MRGDVEDGIGVTVTRPSGGLLADTYINYTTTAAYYYVSFYTDVFDQPLTIKLNAHDVATGLQIIYITDMSVYVGNRVNTSLEGSLTLLQGALEAPTVGANQMSANVLDVQTELLSEGISIFNGPLMAYGGLTGTTGYFDYLTCPNFVGQLGPTGASRTGPTGAAGAASTGATGSTGAAATGATGATGASFTGPTGASFTGATGARGATGASFTGPTGTTGQRGPTGPTSEKLQAFDTTIASISVPYLLQPTSQQTWSTTNGASYTNAFVLGSTSSTPLQQISFTNGTGQLRYVVQNPNGYSSPAFGATLLFAAYGSSSGTLRVATTGTSTASTSSGVAYTTNLAYYSYSFTLDMFDSTVTIALGGNTLGSAPAQIPCTLYVTDFSITYADVINNVEGDLTLLNGTLTAPTIVSTAVLNASNLDVQTSLVTHTNTTSTFQGPVYLQNGCTGATGSFTSLVTNNLNVGATGTFYDLAATNIKAGSVNSDAVTSTGVVAKVSGFLAMSGGGFKVFNGTTYPFSADGTGNITCNSLTTNATTSLQNTTCATLTCSGTGSFANLAVSNNVKTVTMNCSGTGSFGTVVSTNQITCQYPVCIAFYGVPTSYTPAGTAITTGSSTVQMMNFVFSSNTNQNWTPSYTTNYKLAVPYTGLYVLQFTISSASNASYFQFITKNAGDGTEIAGTWNQNILASSAPATTEPGSLTCSTSCTAYLKTTDYICFSLYLMSGSITYYGRSSAQVTLIQRTA
jgi:hypothetical protein